MNNTLLQKIEDLRKELIHLDEDETIELEAKEWNDIREAFDGLVAEMEAADQKAAAQAAEEQCKLDEAKRKADEALALAQYIQYPYVYYNTHPYQYYNPYHPYYYTTYITSNTTQYGTTLGSYAISNANTYGTVINSNTQITNW